MPTVTLDGQEHEVDLDAIRFEAGHRLITNDELAENYIPVELTRGDDAKYVSRESFERRYKNYVPREKATDDEKIIAKVLEKHGKDQLDQDLETAKQQWRESELEPVEKARRQAESSLETFERLAVQSAIDAAAAKVWDDKFASAPKGRQSWAQVNFAEEFAFLPEAGRVVAVIRDENGVRPRPPLDPEKAKYMLPVERMQQLAQKDEWKPYARAADRITTEPGADPSKKGGPGTKRRSEMTTAEKAAYVKEHGKASFAKLPI